MWSAENKSGVILQDGGENWDLREEVGVTELSGHTNVKVQTDAT